MTSTLSEPISPCNQAKTAYPASKPTAQQSSPIDTAAAQLVYDDLRRFCEARRSDTASIITRSQFLLVLTSEAIKHGWLPYLYPFP